LESKYKIGQSKKEIKEEFSFFYFNEDPEFQPMSVLNFDDLENIENAEEHKKKQSKEEL